MELLIFIYPQHNSKFDKRAMGYLGWLILLVSVFCSCHPDPRKETDLSNTTFRWTKTRLSKVLSLSEIHMCESKMLWWAKCCLSIVISTKWKHVYIRSCPAGKQQKIFLLQENYKILHPPICLLGWAEGGSSICSNLSIDPRSKLSNLRIDAIQSILG